MRHRIAIAGSLLFLNIVAWADNANVDLVSAYYEAYNAHDIDRMMSMVEEGVVWAEQTDEDAPAEHTDVEIIDDTIVHTKNREELAAALEGYFDTFRGARSIIRSIQSNGCGEVTVFEEAIWDFAGVPMSQCATAYYFIKNNKITMVLYSGEQPCDDESPSG